jgi:hypothetical protein
MPYPASVYILKSFEYGGVIKPEIVKCGKRIDILNIYYIK